MTTTTTLTAPHRFDSEASALAWLDYSDDAAAMRDLHACGVGFVDVRGINLFGPFVVSFTFRATQGDLFATVQS